MKKKISISTELVKSIVATGLTTNHYRLYGLLLCEPMTQAQMSAQLGLKKQNINHYIKGLITHGLIVVDRIEGKNKFFKAVTELPPQGLTDKRQMSFDDVAKKQR